VVDRLLLQPPAAVSGDPSLALVYLTKPQPGGRVYTQTSTSYPDFATLRDSSGVVESAAAFWLTEGSLDRGVAASRVSLGMGTGDFFRVLGTQPFLGQFFGRLHDDPANTENVAVISHALWAGRFGGDPRIIGRTLRIDERVVTVLGVAPRGFHGPQARRVDVWMPLRQVARDYLGTNWETTRNMYWLRMVGRLAPGVTRPMANERASLVHQRANRGALKGDSVASIVFGSIVAARGAGLTTPGQGQSGLSPQARVATWLMAVAAVVLLIVCANTANLFLARHNRRRRELAVRLALGVRRGRLIRSLLTEALLLAVVASGLALLLTWWGTALMRATLLSAYAWDVPTVGWRVAGFTALAALLTALLAGWLPAFVASRGDLTGALKSGSSGAGRRRTPLQRGLLIAQASLSMLLLVGAGLFVRSLGNVSSLRLGYDADQVVVANIDVSNRFNSDTTFNQFWFEAAEQVRTVPGVAHAALGVTAPFASSWATDLSVPGYDSLPDIGDGWYVNAVTTSWFETVGTRILQGRGFRPTDVKGADPVAVVNEFMARALWPGESAIGKCVKVGADSAPCSAVVGVMENAYRDNLRETPQAQYVVVMEQGTFEAAGMRTLFIRVTGDPSQAIPAIRARIQGMQPDLPFADVRPMRTLMDGEVQQWRLGATMFGLFGAIALVVAAIGLYALVAYDVAQRWHELGIRAALGAAPGHLRGLIVRAGVIDATIGLALGALLALALAPLVGDLLFNVAARDATVLLSVGAVLLVTATFAAVVPARRATRVEPAQVLRAD
jgi:putative ABC transport system permease protein